MKELGDPRSIRLRDVLVAAGIAAGLEVGYLIFFKTSELPHRRLYISIAVFIYGISLFGSRFLDQVAKRKARNAAP
jgi:hypothetical protein